MEQLTDKTLLLKLREGNHVAFRCLFQEYYQRLFLFACKFAEEDMAKDLVQDCFLEYYWNSNLADAATDINKVRERALALPIDSFNVSIEYILDERVRELYAEEPRKCELTRIAFIMADNSLNGYSIDNFDQENYWFDRIQDKNNFYNIGFFWGVNEYNIGAYHVLWPIPQDVIDDNQGGVINQNKGYSGIENNIPPKTEITEEV